MTFNSLPYALFLPAVVLAAWSLRTRGSQNALLLAASYLFYAAWDWRFVSLLLVSTVVDHAVGLRLGATDDDRRRRWLLATSLAVNLGILGTFKYFGFFADTAGEFLRAIGLAADLPTLQVLLPVGISFYTFQTVSYTFDVYRRRVDPEPDIVTFGLYVAFFPQLVAGPIERPANLLPVLRRHRPRPDLDRISSGLGLILFGLWKKVAVADAVAPAVERSFSGVGGSSWQALLVGAYAFAIQIYGDFSGYTDIARGSARLLGVELMHNFRQPYLSRSVTEFWRTWHISLSTWLRDYLYVPLGGNRASRVATYRNLLLVMLLGGLWHGAGWTFVAWGAGHGAWLAVERFATDVRGSRPPQWGTSLLRWVLTLHGVALLFVVFRAPDLGTAAVYLLRLLTLRGGTGPAASDVWLVGAAMLAVLATDLLQRHPPRGVLVPGGRPVVQGVAVGVLVLSVVLWSGGTPTPFIYFQF